MAWKLTVGMKSFVVWLLVTPCCNAFSVCWTQIVSAHQVPAVRKKCTKLSGLILNELLLCLILINIKNPQPPLSDSSTVWNGSLIGFLAWTDTCCEDHCSLVCLKMFYFLSWFHLSCSHASSVLILCYTVVNTVCEQKRKEMARQRAAHFWLQLEDFRLHEPSSCTYCASLPDNPRQFSHVAVYIRLLDINDNAPTFATVYETFVCERTKAGEVREPLSTDKLQITHPGSMVRAV